MTGTGFSPKGVTLLSRGQDSDLNQQVFFRTRGDHERSKFSAFWAPKKIVKEEFFFRPTPKFSTELRWGKFRTQTETEIASNTDVDV